MTYLQNPFCDACGRIGAYLAALAFFAAVKQLVAVRVFMRHAFADKFFKISKADRLGLAKLRCTDQER